MGSEGVRGRIVSFRMEGRIEEVSKETRDERQPYHDKRTK